MDKLIFLSHILDEKTPCYGGAPGPSFSSVKQMKKGDSCNMMRWSMSNHVGTHVDVPRHFLKSGTTADRFPAGQWLFDKVALVKLSRVKPGQIITPADMGNLPRGAQIVLIRTGFERLRTREVYWKNAPGLHPDLAGWLKKKCPNIRAVGMDIISVSSLNNRELGREAHREFLKRGIVLVEDMKLSGLMKAPFRVLVSPLRVKNSDAAPCSVFAWSRP
jgi:kynurenine formamidase